MHRRLVATAAFCILSATLGGCDHPTGSRALRFDEEVTVVARLSSSGGALGSETYRLSYEHGGESIEFFEGTNPRHFGVYKRGANQIAARFCDGNIHRAQPIFILSRKDLIHLHVELDCTNLRPLKWKWEAVE